MRLRLLTVLLVGVALLLFVSGAAARTKEGPNGIAPLPFDRSPAPVRDHVPSRLETLWIFDADFETETGDNSGWTTFDRSGTVAQANYWHHDTIRIQDLAWLGDSTWWCGTYNECWRQPRGYGNGWLQILKREFPEIEANTSPGDTLTLEFDQRYAMEHDYDYGYVEISTDGGTNWTTLHAATNVGFSGKPGRSTDWDDPVHGHITLDLTSYSGQTVDIRFRFESDEAYSSQDEYNNGPPNNSCLDGAWQLDNIELIGPSGTFWLDDSESGNRGWVHDDQAAAGQTGIVFWRGQFGIDFITGRDFTCDDRPVGSWMYAAVDSVTSQMVDGQYSWLMSPPIDISGAPRLVGHWDFWLDMPRNSDDICNLYVASDDNYDCVTDPDEFIDEDPGWWYGAADWRVRYDDWDAFAGNDWLAILWAEQHNPPESGPSAGPHWAGIIFNRQRVGVPSGDPGTLFTEDRWNSFNDWFHTQISEALLDSAYVKIKDDDGLSTVYVIASNDGGDNWSSYPCHREDPQSDWFICSPPSGEIVPGAEIMYYFEATDGASNVAVYPAGAPDECLEMSILPITGSVESPGILLVDKYDRTTPGEHRDYSRQAQEYYEDALSALGLEWDVYDVEVPSGSTHQSDGPDTSGMKYYDTQIWFTNWFEDYTLKREDQYYLSLWLDQASEGKERNLLLTGNGIAEYVVGAEHETLNFYETWLGTEYVAGSQGAITVDSLPGLVDYAGGFGFITDGGCILQGGCPELGYFDVIQPAAGAVGAELVAEYEKLDMSRLPAGVAYTHETEGYQTVHLGFGIEFMVGDLQANGYFLDGSSHRSNLLGNILRYFGKTFSWTYLVKPDGTGDFPTIQDAINAAASGDTIELASGTFTGSGNSDIDFGGKAIVLRSQDGDATTCTIDCESAAQGFIFASAEGPNSVIKNITVTNGTGVFGGAVTCADASPTLIGCRFVSNSVSDDGGALYGSGSSVTVDGCLFLNNHATDDGGAAKFEIGSSPTFTDCEFIGNTVNDDAGAVQTYASTPSFDHCVFSENESVNHAGALIFGENSQGTVTSCTFVGNIGGTSGCSGIAVQSAGSTCGIDNTIIALGTSGEAVFEANGGVATLTCSDLYGNSGGDWIDGIADQLGVDGNFTADPMFCDPGSGDFELHVLSPCADAPGCGVVGALGVGCGVEWLVNPDGSGDHPTIQAAVDAAEPGHTVSLGNGTFTGSGNHDIDFGGKAIVVRSASGDPALCTIDCEDAGRAFYFHSGEDTTSVVEGITVRDGYIDAGGIEGGGGGILCDNAAPAIRNMRFVSSYAVHGGAVYIHESDTVIENCVFDSCSAMGNGGAIRITSYTPAIIPEPRIYDCVFTGNAAGGGGAIDCHYANARILGNLFVANHASNTGGAISSYNQALPEIRGNTLAHNTATNSGAGIACYGTAGALTENCIIWENSAPLGGDVYVEDGSSIDLSCCQITFGGVEGPGTITYSGAIGEDDPEFCGAWHNPGESYSLAPSSPCAEENNPGCGRIGARGIGCAPATISACPEGTPDFSTIQAAIDAAIPGDTIELCDDSVFSGVGNRDIAFAGKAVLLTSVSGDPDRCTIDCEDLDRAFYFQSGEDTTTVVSGITIRNGNASSYEDRGAAVRCEGSSPKFENVVMTAGRAFYGGGMTCDTGSAPILDHVVFSDNYSTNSSGGMQIAGSAILRYVDFLNNESDTYGGAVEVGSDATPILRHCTFIGNDGDKGGAVACNSTAAPTLIDCVLEDNVSRLGGGMYLRVDSAPVLENVAIVGNAAAERGGGIDATTRAWPTLTGVTLARNEAPIGSGAIHVATGAGATIENTIIAQNIGEPIFCEGAASPLPNDDAQLYPWEHGHRHPVWELRRQPLRRPHLLRPGGRGVHTQRPLPVPSGQQRLGRSDGSTRCWLWSHMAGARRRSHDRRGDGLRVGGGDRRARMRDVLRARHLPSVVRQDRPSA